MVGSATWSRDDQKPRNAGLLQYCLADTQIRIRIVTAVPIHVELAAVAVAVRHIAIAIQRTAFAPGAIFITNNPHKGCLRLPVITGFFQEAVLASTKHAVLG